MSKKSQVSVQGEIPTENHSQSIFELSGVKSDGFMQLLEVIELPADCMCCRFSPDGNELAVGLANGNIEIVNCTTRKVMTRLVAKQKTTVMNTVTHIKYIQQSSPTHLILATYANGDIRTWKCRPPECVHVLSEGRETLAAALNPNGKCFVTAGNTPEIFVYDMETKRKINTCRAGDSRMKMDGHRFHVFAAQYNPNHPFIFVTGGWDNTVQYWDERNARALHKFFGPHICGDALDIEPFSDQILTGSWRTEDQLQVWDFISGKKIKDIPQEREQKSQVYCAQYIGRNNIFFGGSEKNMAGIIDLRQLNLKGQVYSLPQAVFSIDHDHSGKYTKLAMCTGRYLYLGQIV